MDLILASGSPRRKELLAQMNLDFSVLVPEIDESMSQTERPRDYVKRLSVEKASAALQLLQQKKQVEKTQNTETNEAILAADTIVSYRGTVFGKPTNRDDAFKIWQQLSESEHEVMTAVSLLVKNEVQTKLCVTRVKFSLIKSEQMQKYWDTGEPQDKAGAYAIQGFASAWVQEVHGSYSNVVGLPLYEVNELLVSVGRNWL